LTRIRREYTEWDLGFALFSITLSIIDFIFIMIGIIYNDLLYQILSYILTFVISLLVYLFIKGKISFKKKTEDYYTTSKKEIFNFLKTNAKNSYTANALLKNVNEKINPSSFKRYIKKKYELILSELIADQQIQLVQKNGQDYYSFPSEVFPL